MHQLPVETDDDALALQRRVEEHFVASSVHDVDARPIRKGRQSKPVEFGDKAQIVDNADGVSLDHNVEIGNPPDAPQLAPAITRITARAGHTPRAVTADRGYGQASVEREIHELGIRSVAIPVRVNQQRYGASSNTGERSARRSNGGLDPKDGSIT
ncbi:MAG: inferenceab initio prediction:Prodigal:2 [Mycobacterium sp.]|jgi:IS5 family transposase|nr:inferenceab initio prediction:Prodigal:2 [Mycobacterium sp.]